VKKHAGLKVTGKKFAPVSTCWRCTCEKNFLKKLVEGKRWKTQANVLKELLRAFSRGQRPAGQCRDSLKTLKIKNWTFSLVHQIDNPNPKLLLRWMWMHFVLCWVWIQFWNFVASGQPARSAVTKPTESSVVSPTSAASYSSNQKPQSKILSYPRCGTCSMFILLPVVSVGAFKVMPAHSVHYSRLQRRWSSRFATSEGT
jgi:hypothetical protein